MILSVRQTANKTDVQELFCSFAALLFMDFNKYRCSQKAYLLWDYSRCLCGLVICTFYANKMLEQNYLENFIGR